MVAIEVKQGELFPGNIPGSRDPYTFDGQTYEPERDQARLGAQMERVFGVMKDGTWRSLDEIASITGDGVQAISARLRDFRKERFGSHTVNRRHIQSGLFEYQLILKRQ